MPKTKWLVYTVLLGLVPMIARALLAALQTKSVPWVSPTDVVGFGLVLVITNINGLEHATKVDPEWKTRSVGLSLTTAILLTAIFVTSCLQEGDSALFTPWKVLAASLVLTLAALVHSYAIWDRLSAIKGAK